MKIVSSLHRPLISAALFAGAAAVGAPAPQGDAVKGKAAS